MTQDDKQSLIISDQTPPRDSIVSISTISETRARSATRIISRSILVHVSDSTTAPFWKRALLLSVISLNCIAPVHCSSFFFPFFPIVAEDDKLVSPSLVGNLFGVLYFLVFFFCLLFGVFIKVLGPKFLYFTGFLVMTVVMFLFAFLDRTTTTWFVVYSFALIFTFSISLAAIYTSSYSIGMGLFPNNQNTVLAIIDTVAGIGYVVGPIIGGLLYDNVGWFGSWTVTAALTLFCLINSLVFLPFIKIDNIEGESIKDYLNIFRLIPNVNLASIIGVNLVVTICWSYQYNSLGPFLERTYHLSYQTIGYVMSVPNISYTILLPIIGIASEKLGGRVFIWLSLPVQMLALVFTPPLYYIFQDRAHHTRASVNASIFPLPHNSLERDYIGVTYLGQALLGVGYTLAYGAMYVDMDRKTPAILKKKLSNLPEILSSLRISSYFFANGIGPIISGYLESVLSFDDQTVIFIFVLIASFVLFTPLTIWNIVYPRVVRKRAFKF